MKPKLLVLFPLEQIYQAEFADDFEIFYAPSEPERQRSIKDHGKAISVVLTTGNVGLRPDEIDDLTALKLICAFGAGYEQIPVMYAESRGVTVTHSPGANDDSVADHAMAMLLSLVRDIVGFDRATRKGIWRDDLPLRPSLSGKNLGVVGLGNIGRKIAERASAGFGMKVGYHTRRKRLDVPSFLFFDSVQLLAQWADFLILAAPGGEATQHIINKAVLNKLGPNGFLVNVGRGSLIHMPALLDVLQENTIAGVALDVYEGEPEPPRDLFRFERVILTPHVAGSSPEAMWGCVSQCLANMRCVLAHKPPLTPVGAIA